MTVGPISLDALQRERYADVEALLVGWMTPALGALVLAGVSTELPEGDELLAALETGAYVQVEAFGGANRNPAQDVANIDIDVYVGPDSDGNANRPSASDIASMIEAALLFHLPGYDNGAATVSDVSTFSRPCARPYDDNSQIRRFSAAYTLVVKSHN